VFTNGKELDDSDDITDKILEAIEKGEKVETSLPRVDVVEKTFHELHKKIRRCLCFINLFTA
jgi:fatty acid-binding protein DegV